MEFEIFLGLFLLAGWLAYLHSRTNALTESHARQFYAVRGALADLVDLVESVNAPGLFLYDAPEVHQAHAILLETRQP
jgi:hypothetical protein